MPANVSSLSWHLHCCIICWECGLKDNAMLCIIRDVRQCIIYSIQWYLLASLVFHQPWLTNFVWYCLDLGAYIAFCSWHVVLPSVPILCWYDERRPQNTCRNLWGFMHVHWSSLGSVWGSHCLQAMRPFFNKRLDTAAAMLDLAKREGTRMCAAISNCISHTYDVGRACVPFWWYSSDTCGYCILPWRCAPTARGCCTFSQEAIYVLLGMLQEEGVDLLIGDSSLCAVMPEVFFPML